MEITLDWVVETCSQSSLFPSILKRQLSKLCCEIADIALLNYEKAQKSIKAYEMAVKLNPKNSKAHFGLAKAYDWLGLEEEVFKELRIAAESDPDLAAGHANLVEQGDFDEGIVHLKKALELNPHFTAAISNLSFAYKQKGDLDNAINYVKAEIAEFNKRPVERADTAFHQKSQLLHITCVYDRLAELYMENGMIAEALGTYRKSLELDPNQPQVIAFLKDPKGEYTRKKEEDRVRQEEEARCLEEMRVAKETVVRAADGSIVEIYRTATKVTKYQIKGQDTLYDDLHGVALSLVGEGYKPKRFRNDHLPEIRELDIWDEGTTMDKPLDPVRLVKEMRIILKGK